MDLAEALGLADRELVAFVGAGGKKTAMATLAEAGVGRGLRVGYTTTTHMPPPGGLPLVVANTDDLPDALASVEAPVAFARKEVANPDRATRKVRGHDAAVVDELFDGGRFDWLLVKADGARRREFKAPGPDEPVIPGASTSVVPVASVAAVGKPLDAETVHRPEHVATITGLDHGDVITPAAVGTVLASDEGGCKGVPGDAATTPLVNKADTPSLQESAREVVSEALERTDRFNRGLVCSFEHGFLEVVERE